MSEYVDHITIGNSMRKMKDADAQLLLRKLTAPWELIREDTVTNETEALVEIAVDGNGQAFELTDAIVWTWFPTQNNEAKNASGAVNFCFDDDYYTATIDVKTLSANQAENIAYACLTQENGLIDIKSMAYANSGNINTLRYKNRGSTIDRNVPQRIGNIVIDRITIPKITGTIGYRIFGRRKVSE